VSALANYLESEGVATVLVSLVAHQSDPAHPPRVLWVPFALGRPLGAPMQPDFQRDVMRRLLRLLDAQAGPVREDFERDAPGVSDNPHWSGLELAACESIAKEIEQLREAHDEFLARVGRTTSGICGLSLADAARLVDEYEQGFAPAHAEWAMSKMLRYRFAADDLKAFYLESVSRGRADVSSRQLHSWLWTQTRLGRTLKAFAAASAQCGDKRREIVGGRFLVPRDWR
jgi:hypothetical protein